MRWEPLLAAPLAIISTASWSNVYFSTEQAQQAIFAGGKFTPANVTLSSEERDTLRSRSGVYEPFQENRVWTVEGRGFFIVDQVVGKHEMITYAVGLNVDGSVKQVEILEYKETYGHEVRDAVWRKQFVGKTFASPVKLNKDIVNITGATLSSKHLTDGVRRVLTVYDLVLKVLPNAKR
jgi:Na+-translocating ferredoxin:NAD+ oxidoreductase RnfG subunit